MNKVAVFRKEHFNAAHRLYNAEWDQATNDRIFGKCALPNYHGHNYELDVKVVGEPDHRTGFVMDMKELSSLVQREVLERFDHRNLNLDCEEFKNLNPTAENIAVVIWQLLRKRLDKALSLNIRLYETERNFVEYSGK